MFSRSPLLFLRNFFPNWLIEKVFAYFLFVLFQNGYNHAHQGQWYPQPHHQQYYGPPHHKRHYYNNRQNNYHNYNNSYHRPAYMSDRAGACMPSSGGDSLAEEEEELRAAENEASHHQQQKDENAISCENHVAECVSKEVSTQKEQQLQKEQAPQPQHVFIPGLPERLAAAALAANGKRLQKKRRKKKAAATTTTVASTASTNGQVTFPQVPLDTSVLVLNLEKNTHQ